MKTKHLAMLIAACFIAMLTAVMLYQLRGMLPAIAATYLIITSLIVGLAAIALLAYICKNIYRHAIGIASIRHQHTEARFLLQEKQERWQLEQEERRVAIYMQMTRINPDLALGARQTKVSVSEPETDLLVSGYADLPALLPPLLTFAEMLEHGLIQSAIAQGKMILGYYADTHELRYGTWLDLYSAGNGGVSGSGKSTTTRFLLFQAVMAQAKLIMIDPHIGDPEESLSHQFSLLPATIHQIQPCDARAGNVLKRVNWLSKELDRRKRTGMKDPVLVFVIDEFNALMRVKEVREELTELLLGIEQEGRKFGIFALLIGQRWSAQDLGGADIRTSLASKMAHRFSDEDQAKRFIGSKYGKRLLELETGHWLFYDTKGKTAEMVTPETYAEDGAIIARILETSPESTLKPRETTLQIPERTTGNLASQEPESTPESTELVMLARQIMALQAAGTQKAEIMRQIWRVNPGGSQEYREAQARYQEVMQFIADQI